MSNKYELILFDQDGTLFDYKKAEEYALKKSMEHFGIGLECDSYLERYRKINRKVWVEFERGGTSLEELKSKRFKILFNALGIDQNTEKFSDKYLYYVSKSPFVTEGAEEVVSYLYGRCKLALATNGIYSAQYERLKSSPLRDYFDILVVSEKIGFAKPDPNFFACVFREAQHSDKSTTLIVGDSLSSDIRGGLNFGIDTCWFNPERVKNEGEITPTYQIEKLIQLEDIVGLSHHF